MYWICVAQVRGQGRAVVNHFSPHIMLYTAQFSERNNYKT